MDDVLPKPFTRKSLLGMLEKHLVHLKTMAQGTEAAPPTAAAVTMAAQNSATQSIKEDPSSPEQSPAGSMNNWQSPGQFQGMPPVPQPMPAVPGQYVAAPGAPLGAYTVDQNGVQFPAPPPVTVPSSGAPPRPQHRRQMSDMSSATENPNVKRQRMYPQPQPMMAVQAGRPG